MSDVSSQATTIVPDYGDVSTAPVIKTSQIVWGVFWGMWLFYVSAAILTGLVYWMRVSNVI